MIETTARMATDEPSAIRSVDRHHGDDVDINSPASNHTAAWRRRAVLGAIDGLFVSRVTATVCGSDPIWDRAAPLTRRAVLCPPGVDMDGSYFVLAYSSAT